MRPRTVFRHCSLPALSLLLLLPLAGCGSGADKETKAAQDETAQAPAEGAGQKQGGGGGGRRHGGPKAHLTLAGATTFDGDVTAGCDLSADKNLEVNFSQEGAPQVQMRLPSFAADGEYTAAVVVKETSGAAREWNGTAKVDVKSREIGGGKKRTAYNGTFDGTYQGQGGTGTLNGNFRRCFVKEQGEQAE
jgi:hypothetical protein